MKAKNIMTVGILEFDCFDTTFVFLWCSWISRSRKDFFWLRVFPGPVLLKFVARNNVVLGMTHASTGTPTKGLQPRGNNVRAQESEKESAAQRSHFVPGTTPTPRSFWLPPASLKGLTAQGSRARPGVSWPWETWSKGMLRFVNFFPKIINWIPWAESV